MEENTQLKQTVKGYFAQDSVRQKFEELLGKRAPGFITSVLQVVSDPKFQGVEPSSVYQAAAVAATLDLPINNNLGFAYIVPYRDGKQGGKLVAQFQMGYKGFKQLSLRSGQFKTMNVTDVREGELKNHDRLTGEMEFEWIQNEAERLVKPITGYVSYFELLNGFSQTFYMSTEKIDEHGKKYSQTYKRGFGLWKDNFESMAEKTVIKLNLSKNAPLSIEMQRAIVMDQAVIKDVETNDVEYVDATPDALPEKTQEEIEHERKVAILAECKTVMEVDAMQVDNPDWDLKLFVDRKAEIKSAEEKK